MASTAEHAVTTAAWTEVAAGPGDVLVQLVANVPVLIHVGTAEPVIDAAALQLGGARNGFQAAGLVTGDKVYVRAGDSPESDTSRVTVVVREDA